MATLLPVTPQQQTEPDEQPTLFDMLLAQQRNLTAVEKFAQRHDQHELPASARRYRDLIPLSVPRPGEQYAFEVDLDKCSGCQACVTACHALNGLDDGEAWRDVGRLISEDWRRPFQQTITTACHHCVDPGCLNGCPVLAYSKDPVTGIVRHLDDQCIGCQYCVLKCPYDVPKYSADRGIVRKCDLCSQRLDVGEAPACAQACPNEAIRITLVDQQSVATEFRHRTHDANPFLPAAPEPALTVPTTRYVSRKPLPPDLIPADAAELHTAPPHWPLVWMLTLTQLSAGGFLLLPILPEIAQPLVALCGLVMGGLGLAAAMLHLGKPLKAWRSFLGLRRSWLSREVVVFGAFLPLAFLTTALLWSSMSSATLTQDSTPHLDPLPLGRGEEEGSGTSRRGMALQTQRSTFLSPLGGEDKGEGATGTLTAHLDPLPFTEVERKRVTTAGGGRISPLSPTGGEGQGEGVLLGSQPLTGLLNWTTALVGLLGVFCSAMVYHDTGRIFWRGARSIGRFFGTTAVLGLAVAWLAAELTRTTPDWIPAALAVAATIKLAGEHRLLRRASHDLARQTFAPYRQWDDWALARSGVLMRDHLGAVTRARFFFGVAGGVVLPLLSFLPVGAPALVAAGACLLCSVTELAERSLFFRAVVVPKMPGTV